MKKLLASALAATVLSFGIGSEMTAASAAEPQAVTKSNILTMAAVWKQTAAEYRALYYQGFNIAQKYVDEAVAKKKKKDKPLAVITDMDDTVVIHDRYWAHLIANGEEFFNDPVWDKYIPTNSLLPAPGALEFLNHCKEKGVEVFYVTSRDQGEGTYEMALGNLQSLGFPYADKEHLTVLVDTSNKEPRQKEITEKYNVIVKLGDSLNDFQRKYYIKKDFEERNLMTAMDKDLFGTKYIIMPNPTDGHWIAAIFGQSEPEDSEENRALWQKTATRNAWGEK